MAVRVETQTSTGSATSATRGPRRSPAERGALAVTAGRELASSPLASGEQASPALRKRQTSCRSAARSDRGAPAATPPGFRGSPPGATPPGFRGSPPGATARGFRGSPPGATPRGFRGSPPGATARGFRGSPPGATARGFRGSPPGATPPGTPGAPHPRAQTARPHRRCATPGTPLLLLRSPVTQMIVVHLLARVTVAGCQTSARGRDRRCSRNRQIGKTASDRGRQDPGSGAPTHGQLTPGQATHARRGARRPGSSVRD